jgi:hypothetical protein
MEGQKKSTAGMLPRSSRFLAALGMANESGFLDLTAKDFDY